MENKMFPKSATELNFAISTPKVNRLSMSLRRGSCIESISIQSLEDWSIISSKNNLQKSLVEKSLKRCRQVGRKMTKKLRISNSFRDKWRRSNLKLSDKDFFEIETNEASSSGCHFSRIVSEREITMFDDYDLVVWDSSNLEDSTKNKSKKNILNFIKRKLTRIGN